jgi:hypothetical protein
VSLTCLFLINGLGLGNSTRCHAVIQHLAAEGCEIHVLTSGNGLNYFRNREEIASLTEMESFQYSCSPAGISGWSTIRSLGTLASQAGKKEEQLTRLLGEIKPDVAVIDSEYVIAPLRRRRIPIVAINNSEGVVTQYFEHRKKARGIHSHFWFVEFSDYWFHRRSVDLVLSPFPVRTPTRHPKFRRIGLIVRPEIKNLAAMASRQDTGAPRKIRNAVFMLSGSIHASQIDFNGHSFPFKIDVVGRTGESCGQVTYHGRLMNNIGLLEQADLLVINGGYSAISESIALRKPTIVLPVPGHAEQFVNANIIENLGLGIAAVEENVLSRLAGMVKAPLLHPDTTFEINGDTEAADAILCFTRTPRVSVAATDAFRNGQAFKVDS